jgi:hypothetical protein
MLVVVAFYVLQFVMLVFALAQIRTVTRDPQLPDAASQLGLA